MEDLSPLQQQYFNLLQKGGVIEDIGENEEAVKRDIRRMNAAELRQAIAASGE